MHAENMKILVQDCKTEEFLRLDSLWTSDLDNAFDFVSTSKAINFGLRRLKQSFRVVEIETNDLSSVPVPVSYRYSREYFPLLISSQLQTTETFSQLGSAPCQTTRLSLNEMKG